MNALLITVRSLQRTASPCLPQDASRQLARLEHAADALAEQAALALTRLDGAPPSTALQESLHAYLRTRTRGIA